MENMHGEVHAEGKAREGEARMNCHNCGRFAREIPCIVFNGTTKRHENAWLRTCRSCGATALDGDAAP